MMHNPKLTSVAQALIAIGSLSIATVTVAAEGEAQKDTGLTEVIITAQKIAQPASKTPLALSVLSGEDLKNAGTVDPRALSATLPNVEISQER